MAEWFKKNIIIIIINAIITIVLSIIGFSVTRVVAELDNKANKTEVARQFETSKAELKTISVRIDGVEKSTDEKFNMILEQFRELREDLRLEQQKKYKDN